MDQKTNQKLSPLEKIDALNNVLDKLADLSGGGRAKCGLIWVAGDLLGQLRSDVLIMDEKLTAQNQTAKSEVPEIVLEEVTEDEKSSIFDEDIG